MHLIVNQSQTSIYNLDKDKKETDYFHRRDDVLCDDDRSCQHCQFKQVIFLRSYKPPSFL